MDECLHEHELLCDGSEHICRTCGVWIEHCELDGNLMDEHIEELIEDGWIDPETLLSISGF